MNRVINLRTAFRGLITIITLLLLLSIWPLGLWKHNVWEEGAHDLQNTTGVINNCNSVTQAFIPTNTHLQNVRVYVSEETRDTDMTVTLVDAKNKLLAVEEVELPSELPAYVDILMDVEVTPEEIHLMKFESNRSLYLGQEIWTNPDIIEISYYNDEILTGFCLVMDYNYIVPFSGLEKLIVAGAVVLVSLILFSLTFIAAGKGKKEHLFTVESVVKAVLNPLVALMCVGSVICIFLGLVNTHMIDNVVAVISVLLLTAILLYAINHDRTGEKPIITLEYCKSHIPELIQSVAFAGAIQGCCEYVSGLYNINHAVSERKEVLWLCIAVIAMFELKDILKLYNLIYLVVSCAAGIVYYCVNKTPELGQDELFVLRMNAIIAVVVGFILIRTVKCLIQGRMRLKWCIPVAVVSGAFLLLTVIFKADRWWSVTLASIVVIFALNYAMWKRANTFVMNLIRGLTIQFVLCTIWVWLFRPYATFKASRFAHFFHTSTVTATYMTIVSLAAAVLIIRKVFVRCIVKNENGKYIFERPVKLRDIWKELIYFAVSMCYLIFTFSRTAVLSAGVAILFVVILMLFGNGGRWVKNALKPVLLAVVSVIIMIPVIFEIQRTIPALVSEPFAYEIEDYQQDVLRGRRLNSYDYMNVNQWLNIFLAKMLSIPENTIDLYHDQVHDFNEYSATCQEILDSGLYDFKGVPITDEEWDKKPNDDQMTALFDHNDAELVAVMQEIWAEGKTLEEGGYFQREMEIEERRFLEGTKMLEEAGVTDPEEISRILNNEIDEESVNSEDSSEGFDELANYANGRFDIYKIYLGNMNMTGHPLGGPMGDNGVELAHAHDVYLEVAYEFGIPAGILFFLLLCFAGIRGIVLYIKNRLSNPELAYIPAVLAAFAIAGIVEWVYQLGHPMTLVTFLSVIPVFFTAGKDTENKIN